MNSFGLGVAVATGYGGTGLTSYTAGDTLYASATDTLAKLAKGTANQMYGMNTGATAPEWKSFTVTTAGVVTAGTWNGTAVAIGFGGTGLSAVGTANQIFGTNAAATGYEHKGVTATLAGAMAGITSLLTTHETREKKANGASRFSSAWTVLMSY